METFTFDGLSCIVLDEETNSHSLNHKEKSLTPGTVKNNHKNKSWTMFNVILWLKPDEQPQHNK